MMISFWENMLRIIVPSTTCLMVSATYLLSLHIWRCPHDRNHPETIKRRFLSVFCMFFIAPLYLILGMRKEVLEKVPLFYILGLRIQGLTQALILPLALTALLFLGSLYLELINYKKLNYEKTSWTETQALIWIRNHIVAPLSEEFVYRSCMLPLLLQSFSPAVAIILNPMFFGIGFQFVYTTLFGLYSAFLFHRTGHLISVVFVHAFCNHMGFPDILEISKRPEKLQIYFCYVFGFILWCVLLNPLTQPEYYYNEPQWYKHNIDFL